MKSTPHPARRTPRRVALDVFITSHCWQCQQARALAQEMALEFPLLAVRIVNLDQPNAIQPASVFAVPTFLLDGKIVSLGTPARDELCRRIRTML